MSYQNILLPALASMANHQRLKDSVQFNECMADHYRKLYQQYRKKSIISAARAWLRWKHYERRANDAAVNQLFNQIPQYNERPIIC